eukprot:CAMPEP_0194039462 /NCGR_PEP_ID=MMETSP0009_2-20130614/11584_1 /TAXON_ID=210454 /ORGANISM="Grammatophora oceanica, Strain CCMP 410" /LENGTH=243 /DNA_ID=CAMNT_0038682301 /DNA_START=52 /DNA_END=783 /DNA_ORIENTATION=+
MTASALTKLATFPITKHTRLVVARGSVVDFSSPDGSDKKGAIINAANEGCLGGGGVDGAIKMAGGSTLAKDRRALPKTKSGVRCPTGSAVTTGPADYGRLQVPYVIHAVGPNYRNFRNFDEPDELLRSAYQTSLDCCKKEGITDVAFALLSSGIFRGRRDLETVLTIGVAGIRDWIDEKKALKGDDSAALECVTLCGFSEEESDLLLEICKKELSGYDSGARNEKRSRSGFLGRFMRRKGRKR